METGLERTCHHLEMYLTGNAAKEDADFKISEIDDHGSQSKGLLRKTLQLRNTRRSFCFYRDEGDKRDKEESQGSFIFVIPISPSSLLI